MCVRNCQYHRVLWLHAASWSQSNGHANETITIAAVASLLSWQRKQNYAWHHPFSPLHSCRPFTPPPPPLALVSICLLELLREHMLEGTCVISCWILLWKTRLCLYWLLIRGPQGRDGQQPRTMIILGGTVAAAFADHMIVQLQACLGIQGVAPRKWERLHFICGWAKFIVA